MLGEQSVVFDPEDLLLLGGIFDQALASLPPAMRTRSNRSEIAKNILASAASGERDPIELELAATMTVATRAAAHCNAHPGPTKKQAYPK